MLQNSVEVWGKGSLLRQALKFSPLRNRAEHGEGIPSPVAFHSLHEGFSLTFENCKTFSSQKHSHIEHELEGFSIKPLKWMSCEWILMQRKSNVPVNDYYYILFYYVSGELRSQVRVADTVETVKHCTPSCILWKEVLNRLLPFCHFKLICMYKLWRKDFHGEKKKLCGYILEHFPVLNSAD